VEQPDPANKSLTFQELTELRRKTDLVSKLLKDQLQAHLETLRPILSPERLLGKHVGGKVDTPVADRLLAQIRQDYRPFSARPFDLPIDFDPYWLTLVGNRVTLHPWEYTHEARSDRETKAVTMTSPVRWVLSFTSDYTLTQMRQGLIGTGERRAEHIRQFVVNALVAQLVITHTPGLAPLLTDLRYQLQTDVAPELPKLPLVTISSRLRSFRPPDELILAATGFSGVPAFVELIDVDVLPGLVDPLQERIGQVLR
jgi:hypothetical protein